MCITRLSYLLEGKLGFFLEVAIKRWMNVCALTLALAMFSGLPLSPIVFAQSENATAFYIAIVIDTSGSTRLPSGVDVNGNGIVGRKSKSKPTISKSGLVLGGTTDPGDSVLAAEVLAAKRLLSQLNPGTTQVAIISFSGDYLPGTAFKGNKTFLPNPATPDAFLKQPLTSDFELAQAALDQIGRDGPFGGTNTAEGIQVATSELTGPTGGGSRTRREANKVVLLLTDGVPTFPVGKATIMDPGDVRAAISSAKTAGQLGIQIYTFALGKDALKVPYTVKEVARVTKGHFTAVPNPGDIIKILPDVGNLQMKIVKKKKKKVLRAPTTYKPKDAYTQAEIDYFAEIALGSEHTSFFTLFRTRTRKWTTDVRIKVIGTPTEEDLQTLNQVVEEINAIIKGIRLRIVEEDPNVKMYFVPESKFSSYEVNYVPTNYGFHWSWWNFSNEIYKSKILLSSDVISQEERSHLIRMTLTDCLGLMQDSWKYHDSIFYQDDNTTTEYADIDRTLIEILYRDDIRPKMTKTDVLQILNNLKVRPVEGEGSKVAKSGGEISLKTANVGHTLYFSKVKEQIGHNWHYPEEAVKAGTTGKLLLTFTILSDGQLEEVRILRSSGSSILDDEAVRAVKTASPFGKFPRRITKKKLHVNADFMYRTRFLGHKLGHAAFSSRSPFSQASLAW